MYFRSQNIYTQRCSKVMKHNRSNPRVAIFNLLEKMLIVKNTLPLLSADLVRSPSIYADLIWPYSFVGKQALQRRDKVRTWACPVPQDPHAGSEQLLSCPNVVRAIGGSVVPQNSTQVFATGSECMFSYSSGCSTTNRPQVSLNLSRKPFALSLFDTTTVTEIKGATVQRKAARGWPNGLQCNPAQQQ